MNTNGSTSPPTILVTLDGSHFSEAILGPVMKLAPALGAEVILFCVGRARDAHDTPVKASYAEMTIVAYANRIRPDLIAMATHGRTGLGHLLAGSVCEAVIRAGVAPVLVLRP